MVKFKNLSCWNALRMALVIYLMMWWLENEVLNWKAPISVHEVRSFLGLAGYYHRFIPDFSKIAKPMTRLLQKDMKFVWTPECDAAFHTL